MNTEPVGLTGFFSVGNTAGKYSEVQAGPGQSFQIVASAPDQPLMVRKIYCLYSPTINQLWEFCYRLVGWSYLGTDVFNGSRLYRALPQPLSSSEVPSFTPNCDGDNGIVYTPKYNCTRILGVTGEMPKGWANSSLTNQSVIPPAGTTPTLSSSFGMYKNYFIDALFEDTTYLVLPKSEISSEADRYTIRTEQAIDQPLQINSNRQTITWKGTPPATDINGTSFGTCGTIANGTPVTSEILWAEDRRMVIISWIDLLESGFDSDRLSKWRNSVNSSPFKGYDSGTLLYTNWHQTIRRGQLGNLVYNVQLIFEYYGPGHNRRLNPKLLYQTIQLTSQNACSSGSATNTLVFPEQNFTGLFISQ
jgi:hypothetical protein